MHVYLAGTYSRKWLVDRVKIPYMLESYYYIDPWQIEYVKSDACKRFMLDSGAFTFMENTDETDFEAYLEKYANFVDKYNIDYFFELDIDSVVGLATVREYRDRLEEYVGKDSIPVWHKSRGKQAFLNLCDEYDYVAIGGIVGNEIEKKDYDALHWFIDQAHQRDAKIHGLGFTPNESLHTYGFDSVDSTSWLSGSTSGTVHQFTGHEITTHRDSDKERIHYKTLDTHNIAQWIRFSRYMAKKGPGVTTPEHFATDNGVRVNNA